MTDEEIEKALKDLTSIDLSDESNYDSCCRIIPPRGMSVIYEALDYINRLKAENEDLYFQNQNLQTYIDNHEEIWKRNAEIDKAIVCKHTAKEILQKVFNKCDDLVADKSPDSIDFVDFVRDTIVSELAKQYGIEVDDE